MRTIVISKHVHSGFSSFQSGDAFLRIVTNDKEIDFKFPTKHGEHVLKGSDQVIIRSTKFPMLDFEKIVEINSDKQFVGIYVESDETFYNKALYAARSGAGKLFGGDGFSGTAEFKTHIEAYLEQGWTLDEKSIPEKEAFDERNTVKWEKQMKKEGFVIWMRYDNITSDIFQGGFSDEVMNTERMKKYIDKGKGVYGYIGHRCRRPALDKVIEAGLRERGLSPEAMYNWLSSGDGRHFGDSLEGDTLENNIQVAKRYLNSMFNLCLIYGHEEHEGTLQSSEEIREILQEKGILLPEDSSAYDRTGWLKLFSVALAADAKASGKKLPEHIEKILPEMVKEITEPKKKPDFEVGN